MKLTGLTVGVIILAAGVWVFSGCGTSSSTNSGGDIGAWRNINPGDRWSYTLTDIINGNPIAGAAQARAGQVNIGGTVHRYWQLVTPTNSPTEGERWTMFYRQDANGDFFITGLDTTVGPFNQDPDLDAVTSGGGSLLVGNVNQLAGRDNYQFAGTATEHEGFGGDFVRTGRDDRVIGGRTYKCYRYTGSMWVYRSTGNPGYSINMVLWLCPEIGGFARVEVASAVPTNPWQFIYQIAGTP